jgi:hypothetical protein
MKTKAVGSLSRALRALLVACAVPMTAAVYSAADDINALFQQGRAAYYKGDLPLAKRLLTQVNAVDPRHIETRAILARIRLEMPDDAPSLKERYTSVRLAKVDIQDATLAECLEALTIMSRNASNGKVQPNLILKSPNKAATKVTLALTDVPLPAAIDYVAELSGTKARWEKHAVVFASLTD